MSADRELLELAAKAAGHKNFEWDFDAAFPRVHDPRGFMFGWNPLADDGDRYRLIAKLGLTVDFTECTVWKHLPGGELIQEYWGGDSGDEPHAVLRAAAQIGKTV